MQTTNIKYRSIKETHELSKPIENLKHIDVSVDFTSGGYNYFSGQRHERGYRIVCSPCNYNKSDNGFSIRESVMLGNKRTSGLAYRIETATRYNEKRLKQLASLIDSKKIAELYEAENDTAILEYINNLTK